MTLNDIIVSALAQLDRGHDAQSLDVWRDKFTRFANDGVTDICATYKPRRTETIDTRDGTFTTAMLSRGCRKVLSVKRDGREEDFYDGDASEVIVTSGGPGKIQVTYRSVPREMFASTDEPDIPAYMHGLLVSYVVGRERAAGDVSRQRGGNIYFQMYEAGKAAIIVVNKWDLVEKDDKTMARMTEDIRRDLAYMTYAPILFISALTGQRVTRLFELINYVREQSSMRITTGMLNSVLADAQTRVQPPTDKGRRLKIYYMTQVGIRPPHFVVFCNDKKLFHFSYRRYLENQIRSVFGLEGTPIIMSIRQKGEEDA